MKGREIAPVTGTARCPAFELLDGKAAVNEDVTRIADGAARRDA